jgi:hypothetical protein
MVSFFCAGTSRAVFRWWKPYCSESKLYGTMWQFDLSLMNFGKPFFFLKIEHLANVFVCLPFLFYFEEWNSILAS